MNDRGMSITRFENILSAYGAEPKRWPAEERQDALALLQQSAEAAAILAKERELDRDLALVGALKASSDLAGRILMDAALTPRSWTERFWPFGPIWQPVTALICASALGVAFGLLASTTVASIDVAFAIEHLITEL